MKIILALNAEYIETQEEGVIVVLQPIKRGGDFKKTFATLLDMLGKNVEEVGYLDLGGHYYKFTKEDIESWR